MEDPTPKRCYYEVLGVDIKASDDDIKRAFKKLSLKNHPDKNRHRQEEAKAAFQEITEAYNTLGDPKQREWYDKNREKILMKKSDLSKEELQEQSYGFDIFAHFDSSAWDAFDDTANGFYTVYREAFETLNNEEKEAFKFKAEKDQVYEEMPNFGNSKTAVEDIVKFYDAWSNFGTIKVFAWADQHDARDGENRYEKRQMEQENERERRKEKKKYVATVRDLVTFVKKNDPRREQLIELARQEELKKQAMRENQKGDKQKKREQQKREEEERKRKKQEEADRLFREQEEKRQQEAERQRQEEEARKQAQNVEKKEKKEKTKEQLEAAQAALACVTLESDPNTLTKKQLKEYKRLQAQAKAEANKKVQQKKEQEKKQQAQQLQKQQQEDDDEEPQQQSGDGQKKKRNRKKKNKKAATEQEEEQQDQEEEKQEREEYVPNVVPQEEQEEQWEEVTATKKQIKQIAKENKQRKKKSDDQTGTAQKNIQDNFYQSIEEKNLQKHGKKQEQALKKKLAAQEEEN